MSENIYIDASAGKQEKYSALIPQLIALTEGETDSIANVSNIVAALKETFGFLWIGIYFVKKSNAGEELVLGPFQGPVACTRIAKGKGVCGSAWEKAESIVVPDVEKFPGHIACSSLSKSEIVIPIIKEGKVVAVLDVDSEMIADFDHDDQKGLEEISKIIGSIL